MWNAMFYNIKLSTLITLCRIFLRLSNVQNVVTFTCFVFLLLLLQSSLLSVALSHFFFCSITWHYYSTCDTKKIEKMQLKAFRHNFFLSTCVAQWGMMLGYRSGGHAFKPCHRTYTLCIAC